MPAIPVHDTQVVDEPWDGPGTEAKIPTPITKAVAQDEWAWYDPDGSDDNGDGYPDVKSAYKFPHHRVGGDGRPGAAVVSALRNGLARVGNSSIPDSDQDGVRRHLQHHLDAFNNNKSSEENEPVSRAGSVLWAAPLVGKSLALRPEVVLVLQSAMAAGEKPETVAAIAKAQAQNDQPDDTDASPVSVIPLYGMITPFGSLLSMLFGGGGGLDMFRGQLDAAVNDPAVQHIVLEVDSPGGLVDMVPETAEAVRQARTVKPITAVANTDACSAAYWIASQANDLVMTPSGQVGSVGVYQMHRDLSGALEQAGIKTTLISAGRYKVESHPSQPLSSDALKAKQNTVDDIYGWFVSDVAQGRGVSETAVRNGFGEGRALLATEAQKEGLVDRVAPFEQVVQGLKASVAGTGNGNGELTAEAKRERFEALAQLDAL